MASDLHRTVDARLKEGGQRYTAKRRALVELLSEAGQPLTIPDILAGRSDLAQSSAYRNLAVLERAEVVRRIVTSEGFARFELVEDLTEHHHHLVCSSCGEVDDVRIPAHLERSVERAMADVAQDAGFATASHRLDLIGTCRRCASPTAPGGGRQGVR